MNIKQIMALADYLDKQGAHEEANKIDGLLREAASYEDEYMDLMFGPADKPPIVTEKKNLGYPSFVQILDNVIRDYLNKYPDAKFDVAVAVSKVSNRLLHELDIKQDDMALDMGFGKHNPFGGLREDDIGLVEQVTKQLDLPGDLAEALRRHVEESATAEEAESEVSGEPSPEMGDVLARLSGVADRLDSLGHYEEATTIDAFIAKYAEDESAGKDDVVDWKEEADTEQSKRYDAKHHHDLLVRKNKGENERVDREGYKDENNVHTNQPMKEAMEKEAASSRYCPEHIGTTMGRVGEATYQCPLDGKVYNWETGFTDYDGKQHAGGSVAAQTPGSSEYETSHRLFDSRENILNRVN